jgi:hypothetical protein
MIIKLGSSKFLDICDWLFLKWSADDHTTDLYYKHVMIVNDNSSVINNWTFKLIDNARVVIYDSNRFILQATEAYIIKNITSS